MTNREIDALQQNLVSARETVVRLRAELAAKDAEITKWRGFAAMLDGLLGCYRLGKRPSDSALGTIKQVRGELSA